MLKPSLVAAPAENPVTLVEAKDFMVVEFTDDDALITSLIAAAASHLDGYSGILGRALINQTWRQDFSCFQSRLRLPLSPFQSISSIQYYDDDNALQTLSSALYSAYEDHLGPYVERVSGASWPSTYDRANAVQVTYLVGYGAANAVPESIKTVIKMIVAELYENRAITIASLMETPIYQSLLSACRLVKV